MAALFELTLDGNSQNVCIGDWHFYVLGDGTLLSILAWPAWCEQCEKFTAAEQVPSLVELRDELTELEYFAERPGHIPPERHVQIKKLPKLRIRVEWRESRIAPPKCLDCGSTAVTSIWPEPEMEIPGRGRCVGLFRGFADMSISADQFYTPEGDRLAHRPKKK